MGQFSGRFKSGISQGWSRKNADDVPEDIDEFGKKVTKRPDALQIVKLKLEKLGYDKKMKSEDFEKFASILSDNDQLLQAYLHTDFNQARNLYRSVDAMVEEDEDEGMEQDSSSRSSFVLPGTSTHSGSSTNDIPKFPKGPPESRGGDEENEGEDDDEISITAEPALEREIGGLDDKLMFESMTSNLRIKLIISETSKSAFEKSMKRVISPFVNLTFSNPPEFGMFHIALGVGPWKIEWNNSSLCIPRTITGRYCMLCADISEIATYEELDDVRKALSEVIVKWNSSMWYSQNGGHLEKNQGNCQEFIDEILAAIGLADLNFPPPLKKYVNRLRAKGMAEMMFEMDEEFVKRFNLTRNIVKFRSHKELDVFVNGLLSKDHEFEINYKHEYHMLKSFDRAFWMRWLKQKVYFHRMNEKEQELTLKYKPLVEVTKGVDDDDEDDEDEEDSSNLSRKSTYSVGGVLKCPFGDPEKNSILPIRVNKV